MPHAFISYVREDSVQIDELTKALRKKGVKVWLDRKDIKVGQDWKIAIEDAIMQGAFFIACFSNNSVEKKSPYMEEELKIAADMLRNAGDGRDWFIPVMLAKCEMPNLDIGNGRTLGNLHAANLYNKWNDGLKQILSTVQPGVSAERLEYTFEVTREPGAVTVELWGSFAVVK